MAGSYLSQSNAYIPALTANLITNFSRKPGDFIVNEIVTVTPVDKMEGYYTKIKPQAATRLLDEDGRTWHDGQPRPITTFGLMDFEFLSYSTRRYNDSNPIGYLGSQQASFDILSVQSAAVAQRCMLFRTKKVYDVLNNSSNYTYNGATNTATATSLSGGKWDVATTTNNYIQKTLYEVATRILKSTYGVVNLEDLTIVIGPTLARKIAATAEIRETLIQQPSAPELISGKANFARVYGLPETLYGMKLIVDPAVEVTSKIGAASQTTAFSVDKDSSNAATDNAIVIARKGGVVGAGEASTSFSSVHLFVYKGEEMATEVLDDPFNKRKIVSVTDNFGVKMVAPEASYLITDVTG